MFRSPEEEERERQIRTVMYQYGVSRGMAEFLIREYGVDALLPWRRGKWGPEYGYMVYEMKKAIPGVKVYELDYEQIKVIKEFLVRKWIPKVRPNPFFPDLVEEVKEKPEGFVNEQLIELISKATTPPYNRIIIRKWHEVVKRMVLDGRAELEVAIKQGLTKKLGINVEALRKRLNDLERILREEGVW